MKRFSSGMTTLFYRNRYLMGLSILVILVAGASAIVNLPRLEDPRIANRNPIIITPVPGASALRVETLVTEVLEKSLNEVDAIKTLHSTSRPGISFIRLELEPSVNSSNNQTIFSEIRDKIREAARHLPADALEPILDDKRDPAAFTEIIALHWVGEENLPLGILNRLAEDLAQRLRNVPGTELVRLYGAPEEEITVSLDPADLIDLGLNVGALSKRIKDADSKTAAGLLHGSTSDIPIEVLGELDSLERIAAIPLNHDLARSIVRLGDFADIRRGWRTPASEIALIDGSRSVLIAARMASDRRIDQWQEQVDEVVDPFSQRAGNALRIEAVFEQEHYTSTQLAALLENLLMGAVIVVSVVFLLMGWRLALIVGAALPLVVAAVLFGLQLSGTAIHQMSIYGMIIALGLLIDNAIVVADEISRYKSAGYRSIEAVDKAVRHLSSPLLVSTFTTIFAFVPIVLLPGDVGDFVSSIGTSVILALGASFVIALTLIAGLAGVFARPAEKAQPRRFWRDGPGSEKAGRAIHNLLLLAYRKPATSLFIACFLPVAGFLAATSLGNEFFPPVDRDMFEIHVWMSPNSSIENTRNRLAEIDTEIRKFEDIRRTFWLAGGSFPTAYYNLVMSKDEQHDYAHGIVTAASNTAAKRMIPILQDRLDRLFPDAQIVIGQFGQGPPLEADVEYRIFGPDLSVLQDLGEKIRGVLQSHSDILHTQATISRGRAKLLFDGDEDRTRLAGLSLVDLASELQANLEGIEGGSIVENLEQIPVRVRYSEAYRVNLERIASTPIVHPEASEWIPLDALGELKLRPELGGITHYNTERTNIIRGYTRNGALPIDVSNEVLRRLESQGFHLAHGYRIEFGGAMEEDGEAMNGLMAYLPVLLVLTLAILILAFNSLKIAGLLGLVAALSVGPGLLATWAIGFPISFNTILGTLGLVGLAFNNSIVVLASIRANPEAKRGDLNAVVAQVVTTTRHILATTLTTIGGFLPLLLIVGGDFWPSLAIVLAGGVGGSMILALLFVPLVYRSIARAEERSQFDQPKATVSRISKIFAVGTVALLLSGCVVGPDYRIPEIQLEPRFDTNGVETNASGTLGPVPDSRWWEVFDDPQLVELIEHAVAQNFNIEIAKAGVREARALRQAANSQRYPNIGFGASYRRRRASENGPVGLGTLSDLGLARIESNFFQSGFDAAWEVDLFGGIQRSIEAADADLRASIESRRNVLISVIAEVARNYMELRGTQRRLQVTEDNIRIQSATLELVRNKYRVGLVAEIDATRAAAQLQATEARIPDLRTEIFAAAHRLAVLTGRRPTALLGKLLGPAALPKAPGRVPTGIPSELLRRRPDVRRAEQRLFGANARIGQATADLYPRFFLISMSGLESISLSDYFTGSSRAWSLGPTIRWPIFQGGKIRAGTEAAEAHFDAAKASFMQTVLQALEEVQNAIVSLSEQHKQREKLAEAEKESLRSIELAQVLYDKGLKDFLIVLDAESRLTEVRDLLAQSETAAVLKSIALYKALGGGWQVYDPIVSEARR